MKIRMLTSEYNFDNVKREIFKITTYNVWHLLGPHQILFLHSNFTSFIMSMWCLRHNSMTTRENTWTCNSKQGWAYIFMMWELQCQCYVQEGTVGWNWKRVQQHCTASSDLSGDRHTYPHAFPLCFTCSPFFSRSFLFHVLSVPLTLPSRVTPEKCMDSELQNRSW